MAGMLQTKRERDELFETRIRSLGARRTKSCCILSSFLRARKPHTESEIKDEGRKKKDFIVFGNILGRSLSSRNQTYTTTQKKQSSLLAPSENLQSSVIY
jgi:ribosome biogenesis SPOUT family RNA methylase Rps3